MSNQAFESKRSVRKKRILSLFLCTLLCVSLCCSLLSCVAEDSVSEVRKELKSHSWVLRDTALGSIYTQIYKFENDGKYKDIFYIGSDTANAIISYGSYTVEDGEIIMTNEDGDDFSFSYSFEDGVLELTSNRGIKLVKND